jgi:hypothetical protein
VRVAEERDLVIIGGGVAGYVAAIKAGQEGLKVRRTIPLSLLALDWLDPIIATFLLTEQPGRLLVSRSAESSAVPA